MKIISFLLTIIGVILVAFGIKFKMQGSGAISIIGGADGPTSVFLAGKVGDGFGMGSLFIGVVLVVAGILIYKKMKKKQ